MCGDEVNRSALRGILECGVRVLGILVYGGPALGDPSRSFSASPALSSPPGQDCRALPRKPALDRGAIPDKLCQSKPAAA